MLYTATATRIAAEKRMPDAMAELRKKIDYMRAELVVGKAYLSTELADLEEKYIAALQVRDPIYAREIDIVRSALENISSTFEGKEVLEHFKAGDEIGALNMLDNQAWGALERMLRSKRQMWL